MPIITGVLPCPDPEDRFSKPSEASLNLKQEMAPDVPPIPPKRKSRKSSDVDIPESKTGKFEATHFDKELPGHQLMSETETKLPIEPKTVKTESKKESPEIVPIETVAEKIILKSETVAKKAVEEEKVSKKMAIKKEVFQNVVEDDKLFEKTLQKTETVQQRELISGKEILQPEKVLEEVEVSGKVVQKIEQIQLSEAISEKVVEAKPEKVLEAVEKIQLPEVTSEREILQRENLMKADKLTEKIVQKTEIIPKPEVIGKEILQPGKVLKEVEVSGKVVQKIEQSQLPEVAKESEKPAKQEKIPVVTEDAKKSALKAEEVQKIPQKSENLPQVEEIFKKESAETQKVAQSEVIPEKTPKIREEVIETEVVSKLVDSTVVEKVIPTEKPSKPPKSEKQVEPAVEASVKTEVSQPSEDKTLVIEKTKQHEEAALKTEKALQSEQTVQAKIDNLPQVQPISEKSPLKTVESEKQVHSETKLEVTTEKPPLEGQAETSQIGKLAQSVLKPEEITEKLTVEAQAEKLVQSETKPQETKPYEVTTPTSMRRVQSQRISREERPYLVQVHNTDDDSSGEDESSKYTVEEPSEGDNSRARISSSPDVLETKSGRKFKVLHEEPGMVKEIITEVTPHQVSTEPNLDTSALEVTDVLEPLQSTPTSPDRPRALFHIESDDEAQLEIDLEARQPEDSESSVEEFIEKVKREITEKLDDVDRMGIFHDLSNDSLLKTKELVDERLRKISDIKPPEPEVEEAPVQIGRFQVVAAPEPIVEQEKLTEADVEDVIRELKLEGLEPGVYLLPEDLDKQEKRDKTLKRVERRFERMASETLEADKKEGDTDGESNS